MRVLLVDDHPLFRQALAATVAQIGATALVEEFETIASVMAALKTDVTDVVLILLDLKLPDNSGMTGLLSIKAHFPDIPVAIVSATDDSDTVQTALACGAAGFVSKASNLDELSAAVEALIQGEEWFPKLDADEGHTALTGTQARILDGIRRGLMNKQIAYELGLSEHTIKYHLTGIFRKMGCQTRAQLVALTRDRMPSAT